MKAGDPNSMSDERLAFLAGPGAFNVSAEVATFLRELQDLRAKTSLTPAQCAIALEVCDLLSSAQRSVIREGRAILPAQMHARYLRGSVEDVEVVAEAIRRLGRTL